MLTYDCKEHNTFERRKAMTREMMREDMERLCRAMYEANRGICKVETKVVAESMTEMKKMMKELGFKYVVGNRAYRNAEDLGDRSQAVIIKDTAEGYVARVISYKKI